MPLTITGTSTEFVSLPEVKAQANVTGSSSDVELDLMRGAAQDVVQGLVGPVLHRPVVETVRGVTPGVVVLRTAPVVSVQSVTLAGVDVTFVLDAASGLLHDVRVTGDLTVTYTAGRTVVPDAIRLATLIIAGHLWKTQLGASPSSLQGEEDIPQVGIGYAIPNRAMDLLAPYLLPPVVA